MGRVLVIGWMLGALTFGAGAFAASSWYEYRMLSPSECALFKLARYDPGAWTVAPNQPNVCYLRRSRLHV
jgi:hypothetical protein